MYFKDLVIFIQEHVLVNVYNVTMYSFPSYSVLTACVHAVNAHAKNADTIIQEFTKKQLPCVYGTLDSLPAKVIK